MPTNNDSLQSGNKRKLFTDAAKRSTLGQTHLPQGNCPSQSSHEPVNPILNASNSVQSFPDDTDGLPAERNSNNDGCIVAAEERMTLHPCEIRHLDELISSVSADYSDDKIPPSVETFRRFTDTDNDDVDFLDKIEYGEKHQIADSVQ